MRRRRMACRVMKLLFCRDRCIVSDLPTMLPVHLQSDATKSQKVALAPMPAELAASVHRGDADILPQ